ncbi:Ig-like domain-containing protein [Corallococcus sp. 4LFB]|uniref:Ig-like domain-containing protein n=1 Tax=Corallococcus sp. 4LFB TaxID=3383249 RepID=UPI003975E90C
MSSQTRQEDAQTFGRLVARLSGPEAPEDFVRSWLAKESGTRESVAQLLRDWPTRADGKLDLTRAPLRLRDLSRGSAAEGQFAFDVLDAKGHPLKLTLTLAYDLSAKTAADVSAQAHRGQAMDRLTPGTEAFNAALQTVTDRLTARTGQLLLEEDPDTQAPAVELTAPAPGSYVRSTVAVTANATDDVGVARVDFFDGTTPIGSSTVAPFTVSWNTTSQASGVHSLTAQAFDAAGNSGTSSVVSVTVDNNPPLIVGSQPQNPPIMQNYVRGTVNASWTVALQGGAPVALAQVFQNGAVVSSNPTSSGSTYYYSWNTLFLGNRSYTLGFQATDAAGNASVLYTRTFIVDNAKPSLSVITSPANGAVVSGVVTLAASASDSQAMAYVIFEVDGVWLTPFATTAPYTKTWDTTGLSGTHTLVAIATDRAGNERRSNPITVTVP